MKFPQLAKCLPFCLFLLIACNDSTTEQPLTDVPPPTVREKPLFEELQPIESGIAFNNMLQENDQMNFYSVCERPFVYISNSKQLALTTSSNSFAFT